MTNKYQTVLSEHEVIRQIIPLMKSVRQFIKGAALLSTEKSLDLTETFSKVESSLQTELFKFAQAGQKVTLIDDVPHLYEFLVSNLSKQDRKLNGEISEQSSVANETVMPKINNPSVSQISTGNLIESLNQQRIEMVYPQFQSRELTKKVEGNEERFTIQLDKFITNQAGTPLEFTKLYENLVSNLSKQDGKLKGKISKQSSTANETVMPKINNPFASQISTENPIESLNQQRIEIAYSQIQSPELTKKVEGNEERFTIQIDKFITNQTSTPVEFTKTELPTRQEFTNQLLNAFKTSKFAQLPNGANRLVIKLNPEHLGSLTVKLVQKNGEMIARIVASTESAKELLDHSVHQLKQALPSVQIEIERFEILTEPFSRELRRSVKSSG